MGAVRAHAVALSLALAACGSETVSRPPEAPYDRQSLEQRAAPVDAPSLSATQKEREIADKYLAALAAPEAAALGPVLADDVHFTLAGLVTTDAIGRRDVLAAHDKLFGHYDHKSVVASRVLLTSDTQSIEWTLAARDTASGKPIGIRGIALVTTKDDGTIRDIHLCFDQGIVQAQTTGEPKVLAKLPLATLPSARREEVEQANVAEEAANVKVLAGAVDALDKDEAGFLAAFAENAEIFTQQLASPLKGRNDLHAYYRTMHATIDGLDATVDNRWGVGKYAIVEYHVVGRQRAKYQYVPVKDPVIKLYFVDVAEMRDAKIARVWRYDNPLQILQP
jgi:hypothetical protein